MSIDPAQFFDLLRLQGKKPNSEQRAALTLLITRLFRFPGMTPALAGCYLATIQNETGTQFEPIEEGGTNKYFIQKYDVLSTNPYYNRRAQRNGNNMPGDGVKYRGRGFMLIRYKNQYRKMGELLELDLVRNPEQMLDYEIALRALVEGAQTGFYTGAVITTFVNNHKRQYADAWRAFSTDQSRRHTVARWAENYYTLLARCTPQL